MTLSVIAGGSSKMPPPSSELSNLSTKTRQGRSLNKLYDKYFTKQLQYQTEILCY